MGTDTAGMESDAIILSTVVPPGSRFTPVKLVTATGKARSPLEAMDSAEKQLRRHCSAPFGAPRPNAVLGIQVQAFEDEQGWTSVILVGTAGILD